MSTNFHVGQKVVCVVGPVRVRKIPVVEPVVGEVYTIREIKFFPDGITSILVSEIVNTPKNYKTGFAEASFIASRFKPVVERKTDLSVFKAILENPRIPIPA